MNPLLDPNYQRGNILPIVRDTRTGERSLGAPQFVVDLLSALMLPGDVYKGNVLLRDPETGNISDEVIKRSADLAGAMTLGAGAVPSQANTLRSGASLYSVDDVEKLAKASGVDLSLSKRGKNVVVNKIVVPKSERGQGVGSKIMEALTQAADQDGLTLSLDPSGDFGGSVPKLKKFYAKFGFEPNKGRTRDFEISQSMRRYPQ